MRMDKALEAAIEIMFSRAIYDHLRKNHKTVFNKLITTIQQCHMALESHNQEPVCAVQDGVASWYKAIPENGTLLYTSPLQPLSDEQIESIAHDCNLLDDYPLEFVRAIERAHGIGVKE